MSRESALIVAVPEAEAVVGAWRARYDPSAAAGVPAHVTLLYPFLDADAIDGATTGRLSKLFGAVEPFDFTLGGPSTFGDAVLWLAPRPPDPFAAMTHTLSDAFGVQPYGGAYDEVTPHLTVVDGAPEVFAEVGEAVAPHLPIAAHASEAVLIEQDAAGRWRTRQPFALGG